jgi:predicted amidophosphoribosyltransferase
MSAAAALLDLLVPPVCAGCGAPGRDLCPGCRRALVFLPARRCARCGLPAPCAQRGRCPAARQAFDAAWAPVAYAGSAPAIVVALKGRSRLRLAGVMAAQIAAGAPAGLLAPGVVLVPVPCHPSRRRARGFDQSARLARALAARTGLPVADVLRRGGAPVRQAGATRAQRTAGGRLEVRARLPAPPGAVLVDDVHTTGATLDACARALRAAGTDQVAAVAWARAV